MAGALFEVKVGGDYACFSRPEFKVERVSYPVITPSAARGVLEAIFWKPEFRWRVRQIRVLQPIRHTTILRNEIDSRQGERPLLVEGRREQRASLILKDVAYVIRAELETQPHAESPLRKYVEQFGRALERGQHHHAPYLGTREFAAWFEPATGDEVPIALDLDIGTMLFDLAFREETRRSDMEFVRQETGGRRIAHGYAQAVFFEARLRAGTLTVPPELYDEVDRLAGTHA